MHKDFFLDVQQNAGNVSLNRSIVDMKNSILVVTENKKAVRTVGKEQDSESIKRYGKLQQVVVLDEKEHELKKLNKITENFSLDVLGDDKVKSGRVIVLDLPFFNIKGEFFIKESNHSLQNGIHKASLSLEVYKDE